MKVKLNYPIEWYENAADLEGNLEIGIELEEKISFRKTTKASDKPWIVEQHYKTHHICNWEWVKKGCYTTEKRAKQAVDQLKKKSLDFIDDFRYYDERVDKPGNVLWPKEEIKWVELKRTENES